MTRIIITQRSSDYHACIEDEPGKWGCGRNTAEAVGSLVTAWPAEFDIELHDQEGDRL